MRIEACKKVMVGHCYVGRGETGNSFRRPKDQIQSLLFYRVHNSDSLNNPYCYVLAFKINGTLIIRSSEALTRVQVLDASLEPYATLTSLRVSEQQVRTCK